MAEKNYEGIEHIVLSDASVNFGQLHHPIKRWKNYQGIVTCDPNGGQVIQQDTTLELRHYEGAVSATPGSRYNLTLKHGSDASGALNLGHMKVDEDSSVNALQAYADMQRKGSGPLQDEIIWNLGVTALFALGISGVVENVGSLGEYMTLSDYVITGAGSTIGFLGLNRKNVFTSLAVLAGMTVSGELYEGVATGAGAFEELRDVWQPITEYTAGSLMATGTRRFFSNMWR